MYVMSFRSRFRAIWFYEATLTQNSKGEVKIVGKINTHLTSKLQLHEIPYYKTGWGEVGEVSLTILTVYHTHT